MNLFLVKLTLSVLVGGSYAVLMTRVSERFGSKLGGLLIGLPSTSLVGYIFIAWTQSASVAAAGSIVSPISISAASLFVAAFVLFYPRFHGITSYVMAILVWMLFTIPFIVLKINTIHLSLLVAACYLAIAIVLVRKFSDQKIKNMPITTSSLLMRGVISGGIIGLAVVLSKVLGPLWGGLMAGFPALFSSTVIILLRAHGIGFASSVAKRMPYGNITSTVFAVAFYYLVPLNGMVLGTTIAYCLAVLTAVILYFVVFPYQQRLGQTK